MRLRRGQRGDTIVEVLICVGVVGAVLTGAFVVTNRSQLGVRDSQEHAEAAKILEGQVELLRSNVKLQGGSVFSPKTTGNFCMDRSNAKPVTNPTGNNATCKISNNGSTYTYDVTINHESTNSGTGGAGQLFKLNVSWDSVTAKGRAQETMYYRLYP